MALGEQSLWTSAEEALGCPTVSVQVLRGHRFGSEATLAKPTACLPAMVVEVLECFVGCPQGPCGFRLRQVSAAVINFRWVGVGVMVSQAGLNSLGLPSVGNGPRALALEPAVKQVVVAVEFQLLGGAVACEWMTLKAVSSAPTSLAGEEGCRRQWKLLQHPRAMKTPH